MNIDFDNLINLAQNDMNAFELERGRIMRDHILSLPEHKRKAAYALQLELDNKRNKMSSTEFLTYCTHRIQENLETLNDLCTAVQVLSEKDSEKKPRLETVNRVAFTTADSEFLRKS